MTGSVVSGVVGSTTMLGSAEASSDPDAVSDAEAAADGDGLTPATGPGVERGPPSSPRKANAARPTRTRTSRSPPPIASILRPPPPPPEAPSSGTGRRYVTPAATDDPATAPVSSFVPHCMQKARPAVFLRPQFQQMTSGARPGAPNPAGAVLGVGAGTGGGIGWTVVGLSVAGVPVGCSTAPTGASEAACSSALGDVPVNSRNFPQEPQNSSPGSLRKPQFEQITDFLQFAVTEPEYTLALSGGPTGRTVQSSASHIWDGLSTARDVA